MTGYPTAICRICGEPIYNSQGSVNRKGEWVCAKCSK